MTDGKNLSPNFLQGLNEPKEEIRYSKNYYLLESLKVSHFFGQIPELHEKLREMINSEAEIDRVVEELDVGYAYEYLENEQGEDGNTGYMPIQSPNLKREHKKLFSLATIKQIEDQKVSTIIKKRLK